MQPETVLSSESRRESFVRLLLAFALTGFILLKIFAGYTFTLDPGSRFFFGQATAAGMDVSARTGLYWKLIFGAAVGIGCIAFLLRILERKLRFRFSSHPEITTLAILLLCNEFLASMGTNVRLTLDLLLSITVLRCACVALGKRYSKVEEVNGNFGIVAGATICVIFLLAYITGERDVITRIALWNTFIFGILITPFLLLTDRAKSNFRLFLTGMFAVPWCVFLGTELAFWLRTVQGIRTELAPLILSFFGAFLIFFYLIYRRRTPDFQRQFNRWFAPSLLFLLCLILFYTPVIQTVLDPFESSNTTNAVLRVWKMGQIPIVDFGSSHMLSEQWYAYIYTVIFGYRGTLDFYAYAFLNEFLYYLLLFWLLRRFFHKGWIILTFLAFFPVLHSAVFLPIVFGALVLIFLERVQKSWTRTNLLKLFGCNALLILWRLDTGVSALGATILILGLLLILEFNLTRLKILTQSVVITLGAVAMLFTGFGFLRGFDLLADNLQSFLHYIAADQAHGQPAMAQIETHQFYTTHFLLPAFTIIATCIVVGKLRNLRKPTVAENSFRLITVLFLLFVFVLNGPRGLVRHGFSEGTELFFWSTGLLALALFVTLWSGRQWKFPVFIAAFFFSFWTFKFFNAKFEYGILENALRNGSATSVKWDLKNLEPYADRYLATDSLKNALNPLRRTLDSLLTKEQTFLDFSNSPMLYFQLDRAEPGYFCQNLQNVIDDPMQINAMKSFDVDRMPVVIYSNSPRNWYDATDGVENNVRYQLFAEYIYEHYQPLGKRNNYEIWVSKTLGLPSDVNSAGPYLVNLGQQPYYAAAALRAHPKDYPVTRVVLPVKSDTLVSVPKTSTRQNHVWIEMQISSSSDADEILTFTTPRATTELRFNVKKGIHAYLVRLSNHQVWWNIDGLELSLSGSGKLQKSTLIKDLRLEH